MHTPQDTVVRTHVRPTLAEKRARFRALHASGCFTIPNPWDIGSALALQGLGFPALASSSAGFAWATGRPDGGVTREQVVEHLRALVKATDVPINADFEDGFPDEPGGVEASVRMAIDAGVAGLSIEDWDGRALLPLELAVARVRQARAAIDASGEDVMLVGRAEGLIHGQPSLDEAIARLKAYADAGADVLFAPGLVTADQVSAVVAAVAPKPLSVVRGSVDGLPVARLAQLGVRRVSTGGGLARAAWTGFLLAAKKLATDGSFEGLAATTPGSEINAIFDALK